MFLLFVANKDVGLYINTGTTAKTLFIDYCLTAVSTAPERFPLIHGMWPVKGITAGGSRITFVGENLDLFLPLGAYFVPPENSTLPPLYGFAYSRSGDLRYSFSWTLFVPIP